MSKKFLTPIGLATLASDPATASEGDMYYNTTSDIPRIYKNGAWEDLAGGIAIYDQPSEPNTAEINIGDLWLDTDAEIVTTPSFNINDTVSAIEGFFNMSSTAIDTGPRLFNNTATFQSGAMYFTFFTPLRDLLVSSIRMASAGSSTSGATLIRFGLYQFDGTTATLKAWTANDPSIFSVPQTVYQRNFTSDGGYPTSFFIEKGKRYAVAVIVIASSPGNAYLNSGAAPIAINTMTPRMTGIHAGHIDLQPTNTTFSNTSTAFWARLS
jgi:hypothetical protein